jgi:hypothetical protein
VVNNKILLLGQPEAKFGSKEFFLSYITNQIRKEGKGQEVIQRVHFSISSLIIETYKGKEAFTMLKNLTEACETLSKALGNRWSDLVV